LRVTSRGLGDVYKRQIEMDILLNLDKPVYSALFSIDKVSVK
jgi:hypothetical protein